MSISIELKRAVYEENDARARAINDRLRARGIFTVNILGGPGAGKTSFISRVAERLGAKGERLAVIEGDVASDIDTRFLRSLGVEAYQIETGGDCHLNAPMIEGILGRMSVADGSWLFIENIGNLVCPAEYVVGEDIKLVVASVAEGSDKPYKYPAAFAKSAACILTKVDLKAAVGFDEEYFRRGLAGTAPEAALLPLNGRSGEGADEIVTWLEAVRARVLAG
ncbi:MAG TPA: hydrogenase nickel incorporation protein HypB [Rectinemataceae bacterium]|nr:hydrogenase nickel incorporation protein HypB [Rectinemataceae bacterium]